MIDPNVIQGLANLRVTGEDSLLERLLVMFLKTASERINSMKTSVASLNRLQLRADAHALKSSAFRLGATELASQCQSLESLIDTTHSASEIIDMVKTLESTHLIIEKELQEILASLSQASENGRRP